MKRLLAIQIIVVVCSEFYCLVESNTELKPQLTEKCRKQLEDTGKYMTIMNVIRDNKINQDDSHAMSITPTVRRDHNYYESVCANQQSHSETSCFLSKRKNEIILCPHGKVCILNLNFSSYELLRCIHFLPTPKDKVLLNETRVNTKLVEDTEKMHNKRSASKVHVKSKSNIRQGQCFDNPCGYGWKCREVQTKAGFSCGCHSRPGFRAKSANDPRCMMSDICKAEKPCKNGGSCLSSGREFRCECKAAWAGKICQKPKNPCNLATDLCGTEWRCSRDSRSATGYNCNCNEKPGWEAKAPDDPQCVQKDVCSTENKCLNGGTCVPHDESHYKCICHPAWTGTNCELSHDVCKTSNVCGEGWKCHRDINSSAGYNCGCMQKRGWEPASSLNPKCKIADRCLANNPCRNGGKCSPASPKGYRCSCPPAWSGRRCKKPKNPCKAKKSQCGDEWRCSRNPSSSVGYSCNCLERPGWQPSSANNPTCTLANSCLAKNPCQNGGACFPKSTNEEDGDDFKCDCKPWWTGSRCEKAKNPCTSVSKLCGTGWSCVRDEHSQLGYNCSCQLQPGWKARSPADPSCVKADGCIQKLCMNGGNCSAEEPNICICPPMWKGTTCEEPRDPCLHAPVCGGIGRCQRDENSPVGFSCNCHEIPGHRALSSAKPECISEDICMQVKPCRNGGTCQPNKIHPKFYKCRCTPAWTGKHCEIPLNSCNKRENAQACGKMFPCVRDSSSTLGFYCDCSSRPGWQSRSKHDPTCIKYDLCLADNPCRHGSTCRNLLAANGLPTAECHCSPAWSGPFCTLYNDPCTQLSHACNAGFQCRRDTDNILGFECSCDSHPGYRAASLQNPHCVLYDACLAQQPCVNGGTCVPVGDSHYYCQCTSSWTGVNCERIREPCVGFNHNCGADWRCEKTFGNVHGFSCGCNYRPGWSAEPSTGYCRISDACLAKWPCQNEGTCQPLPDGEFRCICTNRWDGPTCTEPVDVCQKNASICGDQFHCTADSSSAAGYSCNCEQKAGWKAMSIVNPQCVLHDACASDTPCLNGGRCLSLGGTNFTCICPEPLYGELCQHLNQTTTGVSLASITKQSIVMKQDVPHLALHNTKPQYSSKVGANNIRVIEFENNLGVTKIDSPNIEHILVFIILFGTFVMFIILTCICLWRLKMRKNAEEREFKLQNTRLELIAEGLADREKLMMSSHKRNTDNNALTLESSKRIDNLPRKNSVQLKHRVKKESSDKIYETRSFIPDSQGKLNKIKVTIKKMSESRTNTRKGKDTTLNITLPKNQRKSDHFVIPSQEDCSSLLKKAASTKNHIKLLEDSTANAIDHTRPENQNEEAIACKFPIYKKFHKSVNTLYEQTGSFNMATNNSSTQHDKTQCSTLQKHSPETSKYKYVKDVCQSFIYKISNGASAMQNYAHESSSHDRSGNEVESATALFAHKDGKTNSNHNSTETLVDGSVETIYTSMEADQLEGTHGYNEESKQTNSFDHNSVRADAGEFDVAGGNITDTTSSENDIHHHQSPTENPTENRIKLKISDARQYLGHSFKIKLDRSGIIEINNGSDSNEQITSSLNKQMSSGVEQPTEKVSGREQLEKCFKIPKRTSEGTPQRESSSRSLKVKPPGEINVVVRKKQPIDKKKLEKKSKTVDQADKISLNEPHNREMDSMKPDARTENEVLPSYDLSSTLPAQSVPYVCSASSLRSLYKKIVHTDKSKKKHTNPEEGGSTDEGDSPAHYNYEYYYYYHEDK